MAVEDVEATVEEQPDSAQSEPVSGDAVPPSEKKHVAEWLDRISHAERCHKKAFRQMREGMDLVTFGGKKDWVESDKYTVPIVARHINLAVAQLYAKNPTAVVKRRKKMLYTVWDGRVETLQAAQLAAEQSMLAASQGLPVDPNAALNLQALQQDIAAAEQYETLAGKTAKTLEILWNYVMDEQTLGTKKQLKALVRRTKTNGVGYVKMDFQREFQPSPEMDSRIQDVTQQLARSQQLQREIARGDKTEDSAEVAELRATLTSLQAQVPIVREGLVLSYPKSTRIIIDPGCHNLKTLAGAKWIAECILLTPREIEEVYGVNVKSETARAFSVFEAESDNSKRKGALRVYEVQDKSTGTFLTVCEGHSAYLKAPDLPPVSLERFFTVFPLVFNEIEHEEELFPPSDVWRARHIQDEYNRSREGLREHRVAARPWWVARTGAFEKEEYKSFANRAPHEIVNVMGLADNQDIKAVLQAGPTAPIDPNLYEVETINTDMLRTVGVQEANLGGLAGATATEASIGEASRVSSVADNVDDLDELLTDLSRNGGQVLMAEMSKDKVVEIVGPGAVWPDSPPSRQELARDLLLEIKSGSSGRPNKAAELANMERAMPFLIQVPGIPPRFFVEKYAPLFDVDPDEMYQESALSIVSVNQIAGGAGAPPTAGGPVPAAQGGQGASRQAEPDRERAPGPQAANTQPGEQVVA